ncbi:integral membrane protein, YkoY family [Deinococcus reticulitermitis]|uniref:Integral membrane protein, YkoY family n=1 Tax=Deinococcus reticulitermitis TaxID=856736 RepID=A0A1H6URS8_9DEIO|nr:tellurium resistance protein TerC [Deinococcus reticulitermitis]SEI93404.1 integral membrane protein, YkoY family [Deinococcus reticulitermitis]
MFGLEMPPITPEFWAILGTLVLLEGLLSADNALVLAVMVRHLKQDLQRKALAYGIGGAVVLRILGVLLAGFILEYWWLRAFGAAYLAYLAISHFTKKPDHHGEGGGGRKHGFWMTVVLLNLTDLAFSVDSILAGVALIPRGMPREQGMTIVVIGGIIGLILMRVAATVFLKVLNKYPAFDNVAYALVGWIAVKLGIETLEAAHEIYPSVPTFHIEPTVFWGVMAAIAIIGSYLATRHPAMTDADAEAQAHREGVDILETEAEDRAARR